MITTSQFQERLIEYLDGELPEAERREVEEYLRAHPEAARLEGDLALVSEAGRSIRESSYPADLLLEANRSLAARLGGRSDDAASVRGALPALSGNGSPQLPGPPSEPHRRRRWRPRAVAAALAAAGLLLAGAASQRAAIAEVAGSLLQRIRVTIGGKPAEVTIGGLPGEVTEALEIGNGLLLKIEGGETDNGVRRIISVTVDSVQATGLLPERGDTTVLPIPTGKVVPDLPAQSWGEVKQAVDPATEASP